MRWPLLPLSMPAGHEAKQIPDGSTESPFLKLFGRATRDTSFESQRNSAPSMEQSLYLVNSDEFQAKVVNSPRMGRILEQKKSDAEIIEELYFATLARAPTEKENQRVLEYVWGESKAAIDQASAEKKAAEEALAKVKGGFGQGHGRPRGSRKSGQGGGGEGPGRSKDAGKPAEEQEEGRKRGRRPAPGGQSGQNQARPARG